MADGQQTVRPPRSATIALGLVASDTCFACWSKPTETNTLACAICLGTGAWHAARMCRGKRRLGLDAAVDRASIMSIEQSSELDAYPCPVCNWWHVGNVGVRLLRKQRTLMATLWVRSLSRKGLVAVRRDFEPV